MLIWTERNEFRGGAGYGDVLGACGAAFVRGAYWSHNGSGKEDVKGDERISWWNVGSWEGCWRVR